jgi:hypothetical protein
MALGAFQHPLTIQDYTNALIVVFMYLIFISSFWAKTQNKLINLNLTSSCILDIYEYFTTNVGSEVIQAKS